MRFAFSKLIINGALCILMAGSFSAIVARYSTELVISAFVAYRMCVVFFLYFIGFYLSLRIRFAWRQRISQIVPILLVFILIVPICIDLVSADKLSTVWLHVQNMGVPFMPMFIVGVLCMRDFSWAPKVANISVKLGGLISFVGVLQWLCGYSFMRAIGTNMMIGDGGFGANYGSALNKDGMPIFRVFSLLMNHYDVCAYLIMAALFSVYLLSIKKMSVLHFSFFLTLYSMGMLVTYNVSGWLLFGIAVVGSLLILSAFGQIHIRAKWKMLLSMAAFIMFVLMADSEFANRLRMNSNIDLSSGSSAASRLIYVYNSIELIKMKPMGWGWTYFPSALPRTITTDNYYFWIGVFGGIWYVCAYVLLFVLTLLRAFFSLSYLRRNDSGLFSLQVTFLMWVSVAFLCGLSNFFIAKAMPTVVLYWLCMGTIWSIPLQLKRKICG